MKRRLGWSAAALAVLLAAPFAAGLLLRALLPLENIRSTALRLASERLGREVRVVAVSAALGGAELRGLEISEFPNFKAGTAFKADRVALRIRWLPLLKKKIEIQEVIVSGWEAEIVRGKDLDGGEHAPKSPRSGSPSVGRLRFERGSLRLRDERSGFTVDLNDFSLRADRIGREAPFPVSAAFSIAARSGWKRFEGEADFKGRFDPGGGDPARMALTAEPFKLKAGKASLSSEGRIEDFAAPKADLRLNISPSRPRSFFWLGAGLSVLPLGPLEGRLRLRRSGKDLLIDEARLEGAGLKASAGGKLRRFDGPKPEPDISFSIRAELPEISAKLLKAFLASSPDLALPRPRIEAKARWKGGTLAISSARLALGPLDIKAAGSASFAGKAVRLDLRAETNDFKAEDAARLVPALAVYQPKGRAQLRLRAAGAFPSPALQSEVRVSSLSMILSGRSLSSVEGSVRTESGTVLAKLKGRLDNDDFELDAVGKGLRGPALHVGPELRVDGRLSRLDLTRLAPEDGPSPEKPMRTSGRLAADSVSHQNFQAGPSEISWDLSGLGDLRRLSGTLKLRIGEGKFDDLGPLARGPALLKMALLPILALQKAASLANVPMLPVFDRVSFRGITGDYALENGTMTVRECRLEADAGRVSASGTADLPNDELNLRFETNASSFTAAGSLSDLSVAVEPVPVPIPKPPSPASGEQQAPARTALPSAPPQVEKAVEDTGKVIPRR
ncbi:MAG: AsmA family protein [Elusimicrobia bacterium]|nr:AsmA family protein [Elusimicrobiota bacterium]